MADQQQLQILQNGVEQWNQWRAQHPKIQPDLSNAFLGFAILNQANLKRTDLNKNNVISNYNLTRTDLNNVNLSNANLSNAILFLADLIFADLSNAILLHANLIEADLSGANLSNADLSNANFKGANLSNADLSNANFKGAKIGYTPFGDRDFRLIKGLEMITHEGPSPLSINSLYLSEGDIPEAFVKGTGAPNTFIEYMRTIAAKPIEYYTCFISYSSQDQDFAERLYADLQQKGVRCWYAPEDLKIGDPFRKRIDESIRLHDKLLLVLSEHSVNSAWVEKEVETAFEKEHRNKSLVLFPIKLDETVMHTNEAWAADIRRMRHIGDLTRWKDHDAYQRGLQRLLRDLKQEKA